jgi:membrane protease YdiL (CAAX protease family)
MLHLDRTGPLGEALPIPARCLAALAAVPLVRILELATPFGDPDGPAALATVAGPLVIVVVLAWRSGLVTTPPLGLPTRVDVAVVAVSLPLAVVLFALLDTEPVGSSSLAGVVAAAGAVAVAAVAHELVFRGLVQASLTEIWGGRAVLAAAALSAIAPVGTRTPGTAAVACATGVLFGLVVRRTGSIVGAAAAHAVVAVATLVLLPAVA